MVDRQCRQARPEVTLLLLVGVEPKTLIARGYSKGAVYNYNKKLPQIRKRLNDLLKEQRS